MKIAVIGCGFFAENHLHAWQMVNGADVVALCDTDKTRLDKMGQMFGISARFTDAATMLSSLAIDTVDIVTGVDTHRPLVELAAQHRKHVICQKPFAKTMADARAMVDAVHTTGKTLMVHENFRWQSAVRNVVERVRDGEIGQPFFARVSFRSGYDVFAGQPYLAEGERFIIEDLGIHILDIARALLGDATQISATTKRVNPNIKGEDVATMILTHKGGATSVVDCSYATLREPETFPESLIEIDGETGSIRLDAGYRMTLHKSGETTVHDLSPPVLPWASKPWHNIQESVVAIQEHFVHCHDAGKEPETSGHDNLQTLALVEAAYVSAAERRAVDMMTI